GVRVGGRSAYPQVCGNSRFPASRSMLRGAMAVPSRSHPRSAASALRPLLEIGAARARLRDIIHQRSFGRGEIRLASGRVSDFYFNLKPAMLDAEGAALLAQLTLDALAGERI